MAYGVAAISRAPTWMMWSSRARSRVSSAVAVSTCHQVRTRSTIARNPLLVLSEPPSTAREPSSRRPGLWVTTRMPGGLTGSRRAGVLRLVRGVDSVGVKVGAVVELHLELLPVGGDDAGVLPHCRPVPP